LKKQLFIGVLLSFVSLGHQLAQANEGSILYQPVRQGKFLSSLLYSNINSDIDFDTRGDVTFKSNTVGVQFGYGVTDRVSVALRGGSYVDPEVEATNGKYTGHSGYFYGIDLYDEIFPATGFAPGVQVQGGITGMQVSLQSLQGSAGPIDQQMTGYEYHGSVLLTSKFKRAAPYIGMRAFGSTVYWRDNSPASNATAEITGHAKNNASLVLGLPVQIAEGLWLQTEGRLVGETAVTVGFTIAGF
jgi:hypothetical protein